MSDQETRFTTKRGVADQKSRRILLAIRLVRCYPVVCGAGCDGLVPETREPRSGRSV